MECTSPSSWSPLMLNSATNFRLSGEVPLSPLQGVPSSCLLSRWLYLVRGSISSSVFTQKQHRHTQSHPHAPTHTHFLAATHLTMNEQVSTHQLMPLIRWPLTETSAPLFSLPQEEEVALSRCTAEEVWPSRCSRPGPVAPHCHLQTTRRHRRACSQLVIIETIQYTHAHGQGVHSSVCGHLSVVVCRSVPCP